MPKLQNFSVPRNNDEVVTVLVESAMTADSLAGATVEWSVYGMDYAVPIPSPQLIVKDKVSIGGVTILDSPPMTFVFQIDAADTADLALGNYYHEAVVTDNLGNRSTVLYGAMALTMTLE